MSERFTVLDLTEYEEKGIQVYLVFAKDRGDAYDQFDSVDGIYILPASQTAELIGRLVDALYVERM